MTDTVYIAQIAMTPEAFEQAKADARREALEQAAKVCDKYAENYEGWAGGNDVAEGLAEDIRALIDAKVA